MRARSIALTIVMFVLPRHAVASPPGEPGPGTATSRPVVIDIGDNEPASALGEQVTGPPPDVQHPSLLQGKYRGVPDPTSGPVIDDPLADPPAVHGGPPPVHDVWLGARVAGGMFDDGAAAARPGLALAVAGRIRMAETLFVALRADWSRRGGEVMTGAVDVLGGSAGLGVTIAGARGRAGLALALTGQLRGDVRITDRRAAAPVRRAGLGLAVGAELTLPRAPFALGLRFEQGLTELVAGVRDRALLVEVGVDWR